MWSRWVNICSPHKIYWKEKNLTLKHKMWKKDFVQIVNGIKIGIELARELTRKRIESNEIEKKYWKTSNKKWEWEKSLRLSYTDKEIYGSKLLTMTRELSN
jgi:hypothetical protein